MTLWGSRFGTETDGLMRRFNDSITFDQRLYAADIRGSIAYAAALAGAGLITAEERDELVTGLERVRGEFEAGTFHVEAGDEDIHTAVERRLSELVGSVAGKLHTGRSRNDQVTTDLRIYMVDEMASLRQALIGLQAALMEKAKAHLDVIMPGYTHLQQAQPVLFGHWLMSYFWKFQRDQERLAGVAQRTSVLSLGSGALAGNPLGIDRHALANQLGFSTVAENSVDAVSDRDYVVEFLAWAALVQIHLSGLAEDLIIWSTQEFGFVHLDEAYATGSSLMPQKRNPDSLELIRGKSGRILGHLTGLLTVLKGLPSAYNKDLQEDKEAVFDAIDTMSIELPIAAAIIRTLKVNSGRMTAALDHAILATDLADYLVSKGVHFRESHHIIGQAVRRAEEMDQSLIEMSLTEYQSIHQAFGEDVYDVFDCRRSIEARDAEGGTAPAALAIQLERAEQKLKQNEQQPISRKTKR
jgi:argininosuccinate lyase